MSGVVNRTQRPVMSTSNVLGANGGVGIKRRVGASPYRLYAEARHHYVPTKNMSTQLIAVTVEIRF